MRHQNPDLGTPPFTPPERLGVDRRLEEALTHGADPLHLGLVFSIEEERRPLRGLTRGPPGGAAEQAAQ
ncbi:hypothetical protein [Streptomyces collinus]|uniref:hypothetical protein n=1 Tax=Streptomyces collinus TaxID=42684 RepID=UPI0034231A40